MPGQEIWQLAAGATVGIGKGNRPEFTGTLRVQMVRADPENDLCETGWDVIQYIRANGYEFGSHYQWGETEQTDVFLSQIDPPQLVDGSFELWDVDLHYVQGQRNVKGGGATDSVDLRPRVSIGTVATQGAAERALYRGGYNGPGGSVKATLTLDAEGNVSSSVSDGEEGDGSFSRCVGIPIVNNEFGKLSRLGVGGYFAPFVQNSANDEHNPAPQRQVTNGTVTIERNVYSAYVNGNAFPVDWVNNRGVVLFTPNLVLPIFPYTMKLSRWTITEEYDKTAAAGVGKDYLKIVAELELKPSEWRLYLRDAGTAMKVRAADATGDCDHIEVADEISGGSGEDETGARVPTMVTVHRVTAATEALLGGKFTHDDLKNTKTNDPVTGPKLLNGNGQRLGSTLRDTYFDEVKLRAGPLGLMTDLPADNIYNPVISVWSIYDEIDPLPLPFFRGIMRPL